MKTLKKLGITLLVSLLALMMAMPAMAADGAPYTYTVRVFAGAKGTIDGQEMVEYTGKSYGERVDFDIDLVALDASDNNKYYVRGIRESGKDNDTVAAPSILVTGDVDYVVAYGIKGDTVAYVVNYQDAAGNTLRPSATYYGNVGDKPVVAYQYIEGYQPNAYNLTKRLSSNEAENVFTFTYTPIPAGATEVTVEDGGVTDLGTTVVGGGGGAGGAGAGAGGGAGGAGAGGAGGVDIQENDTPLGPPDDIIDLDEPRVPLDSGSGFTDKIIADASALPMGGKIMIAGGGVLVLGVLAALLLFLRKKHKERDEDE